MNLSNQNHEKKAGLAGALATAFIKSKLTPLLVMASVLLGILAVALLPREEEPQIKVPMIDVLVAVPGFSAKEIELRVTAPMEKLIWEIPGVEYVYSITQPGQALVIVRYLVGEDIERSLVKLNQKLQSNFDRIPPGVSFPLLKARSIDDVPILALTFHSKSADHFAIRRVVAEIENEIKQVADVSETQIIGGLRRQVRVQLNLAALAARRLDPISIIPGIQAANRQQRAGSLVSGNQDIIIETGGFLRDAADVGSVVIGVHNGAPIYLRDVATIVDGPEELSQAVMFGGKTSGGIGQEEEAAATLSIAKRTGTNAIQVAEHVLAKVEALRGTLVPADIEMTITRHYGETAAEKSNELLLHMLIAVVSVSLLILISLGWRESIIVALAIPSTLALTLLVFYLTGFTLNRITLFALIFSIGILVDDAIVDGLRRRLDGAIYAPDSDWGDGGDVVFADRSFHCHSVGSCSSVGVGKTKDAWHGAFGEQRRLEHALIPAFDGTVDPRKEGAADLHDRQCCAVGTGDGIGGDWLGAGQNAAIRQQERISDHHQHAGGQLARKDHAGC